MEAAARAEAQAKAQALGQVVQMAQNHAGDTIIINQIRTSGTSYHLTGDDIVYLKSQGVDDAVITEMQAASARMPPHPMYVPAPAPAVVYAPEPAPFVVGVGAWRR